MNTLKKETAVQAFKREVAELKPLLPADWRVRFFLMHPEYDSYRGGQIVDRVYYENGTDSVVLEGFKRIIEEEKQKQNQDQKTA